MEKHLIGCPWNGFAASAAEKCTEGITPHPEYLALGSDQEERQTAYPGLFRTDLNLELLGEIWTLTDGVYVTGDSRFRAQIEHALNQCATPRGRG